jgi:PI-3-kinase-related kinase SMG-1
MVRELQRISLLWDELWAGTIQQYGAEISRRVRKMEEEVNR